MSAADARIAELRALEERYAMPTYPRAAVEFVRGRGSRLWDSTGKEYVDLFTGLSVHNAGHCHPAIVAAISEQAAELGGTSNLFYSEPALRLCERLAESSLGGRAFLTNSGTEANECAIKVVRRHAHQRGIEEPEIVVLDFAFHGRTMAALSATPRLAREDLFGPLLPGFVTVPRDDPDALRAAVGPNTAAVMLEPIQGEAGIHPIDDEVLLAAREACDQAGALLCFDEIQTGMGRTGRIWAYQGGPVVPDVLTAAKALGGGLPVGGCVISPAVGDGLVLGEHGSTFAGGPIAARAALAALEVLSDPDVLADVTQRERQIRDAIEPLNRVSAIRGRGLMLGIALAEGADSREIAAEALASGVVVNAPNPETIRLLPALTIDEGTLGEGLEVLARAIDGPASASD